MRKLKKLGFLLAFGALVVSLACTKGGGSASEIDGKALFEAYCISCHKDGGNIVNPQKTLHRSDRESNGIKSPDDIVKLMRNPGTGMPAFGRDTIPDDKAIAVAEYVIGNF